MKTFIAEHDKNLTQMIYELENENEELKRDLSQQRGMTGMLESKEIERSDSQKQGENVVYYTKRLK